MSLMHACQLSLICSWWTEEGTSVRKWYRLVLQPVSPAGAPLFMSSQKVTGHTEGGPMTEGRGVHSCLDPGLKIERQTQAWGPRRSQGRRPEWGRQPGPRWALYPNMEGFFFLSPFESRRPWPKRSALQIQRAGLCQPCRAYPLPFLAISAPSQPPEAWNQPVCAGEPFTN